MLRSNSAVALLIAVCVAVPYFASAVGVMNSMDGPQYALTRAIVERKTLSINGYDWVHPDFALVNGRMYSKRSPGVSFLALPFYLYSRALQPLLFPPYAFTQVTAGVTADSPVEAMTYGLASLIAAADVALCYLIMRQLGVGVRSAIVAVLLFGFGSLLWGYSASLVREPAVIMFLLLSYLCVVRIGQRARWQAVLGLGIASGLAVMCDNLALFPVIVLLGAACWFLYRQSVLQLGAPLAGALFVGLLPLMSYNLAIFGQPFAIQYLYDQNPLFHHAELHTLADPLWSIPVNLFNLGLIPAQTLPYTTQYHPPADLSSFGVKQAQASEAAAQLYAWDQSNSIFFALHTPYKGIMMQSPVLFLGLAYALLAFRDNPRYLLALAAGAAFFLPLSKVTYFYNPNNYDTRYFLPATAFLFLPLGACFDWVVSQRKRWKRWIGLVVAALLAFISVLNGWQGVLQNYKPHLTGQERSSLWVLMRHDAPVSQTFGTLMIQTFPNYANLLFLLPILALLLICAFYVRSDRCV